MFAVAGTNQQVNDPVLNIQNIKEKLDNKINEMHKADAKTVMVAVIIFGALFALAIASVPFVIPALIMAEASAAVAAIVLLGLLIIGGVGAAGMTGYPYIKSHNYNDLNNREDEYSALINSRYTDDRTKERYRLAFCRNNLENEEFKTYLIKQTKNEASLDEILTHNDTFVRMKPFKDRIVISTS